MRLRRNKRKEPVQLHGIKEEAVREGMLEQKH